MPQKEVVNENWMAAVEKVRRTAAFSVVLKSGGIWVFIGRSAAVSETSRSTWAKEGALAYWSLLRLIPRRSAPRNTAALRQSAAAARRTHL